MRCWLDASDLANHRYVILEILRIPDRGHRIWEENFSGAKPSSWTLEVAYDFELEGKEMTVARVIGALTRRPLLGCPNAGTSLGYS